MVQVGIPGIEKKAQKSEANNDRKRSGATRANVKNATKCDHLHNLTPFCVIITDVHSLIIIDQIDK